MQKINLKKFFKMENKKIRALFIIPNLNQGGSQKLIINLINFIKIKTKILFIYKKDEIFLKKSLNKNIKLIYSNKNKILKSFFEVNRIIEKKKINLIFSCLRNMNIIIGMFAYFFTSKVKIVFHEPNVLDEFRNKNIINLLKLFIMKLSYRKAHHIIANSNDTKKDLLKYKIVPKKKIIVISNPISVSEKKLDNIKNVEKFINSRYPIIGCGTLTYQKNFQLLIKAFDLFEKKIKNSCLLIVGDGPEKSKLKKLIYKLKLSNKVMLCGSLENPYIVFKASRLFVLSSRFEGFGNVLIEALFAKLNIVSTNCPGGPKDILENGKYGYLAKNDDVLDLSYKMLEAYKKPKKIMLNILENCIHQKI